MPALRPSEVTPASVLTAVAHIRAICDTCAAVASQLQANDIEQITVDLQPALRRAMDELHQWSYSLNRAATDALDERGAFTAQRASASGASDSKPKRRKTRH